MMTDIAQRVRRRTSGGTDEDEGFALIYALMLILFVTALSVAALSLVLNEIRPTEFERKRETTLNAAQAGIDASLSQLRNSVLAGTSGRGVVAYLPCNVAGTGGVPNHASVSGNVTGSTSAAYTASIYYFSSDPTTLTPTQVASGTASGEYSSCSAMSASVPAYAYVIAKGTSPAIPGDAAATGDRALHAVYPFATSSAIGNGGTVYFGLNCWTAPNGATVGSSVSFQPCLVAGTPSQQWYYRPDLSVQWTGNPNPDNPLCLDYSTFSPTTKPVAPITLQKCLIGGVAGDGFNVAAGVYGPGSTNANAYQEFVYSLGFKDVSLIPSDQYSTTPGQGYGNSCITSVTSGSTIGVGAVGETLVMSSGCPGSNPQVGNGQNLVSVSSGVGAGDAAGATTGAPGPAGQFSNVLYNACMGFGSGSPKITNCGQSGNPNTAGKDTVFAYSGTATTPGTIKNAQNSTCLTTAVLGGAPTAATCTGATTQQWQLTETVAGDYVHSYLIEDVNGNCLTSGPPTAPPYRNGLISMTACPAAGVTTVTATIQSQQWNAPPRTTTSQVKGLGEDPYS